MQKFKYNNYSINYEVHGQGEKLLLLNGIMMSTKSWHQFIPVLSKNNQLILVDFLDQGSSDSSNNEEYLYELQTEIVKALLEHLEITKINIAAISYGGQIALDFASKYPDLVNKLIIFNTTAKTSAWMKEIYDLWMVTGKNKNNEAYYKATIPTIYSQTFFEENLKWMKERESILFEVFKDEKFLQRMEKLVLSVYNLNIESNLKAITANTLVVASEEDFLTPVKLQENLNSNITKSNLVLLPNTGHASMYEKPELFTTFILGFINS